MVVIRNIFLISILGVLLLVAGGVWGIAGSSLHSIRRLTTSIGIIQVLQNLISNAIKYNLPNGWIRIDAYRQGATVLITISNCSKEIPVSDSEALLRSADRHRIFDRFHRGDPARTRQVEGIGLGLSLAREIARAHGGDLTLDPTLSGQTGFTLTLPVAL